jgi:hypothetical protein
MWLGQWDAPGTLDLDAGALTISEHGPGSPGSLRPSGFRTSSEIRTAAYLCRHKARDLP